MALRKLTRVHVRGNRAFHYFKKPDGELERVPCSLEQYRSLGLRDAGKPPHPLGYEWSHSAIEPEYDTHNGDLPDDSYAYLPDRQLKVASVKIRERKDVVILDTKEIVNNEVEII